MWFWGFVGGDSFSQRISKIWRNKKYWRFDLFLKLEFEVKNSVETPPPHPLLIMRDLPSPIHWIKKDGDWYIYLSVLNVLFGRWGGVTLWLLELEEQSLLRYVSQFVTICAFQTSYFRHTLFSCHLYWATGVELRSPYICVLFVLLTKKTGQKPLWLVTKIL